MTLIVLEVLYVETIIVVVTFHPLGVAGHPPLIVAKREIQEELQGMKYPISFSC